jgi:hypothetical protein
MSKLSKSDHKLIKNIANRALTMGLHHDIISVVLDITVCHFETPLRLDELFAADDANFIHDICGINRNLDRKTGKLLNNFTPRYSCSTLLHLVCSYNEDNSISIDKAFFSRTKAEKEAKKEGYIYSIAIEDINDFIITPHI